MSTRKPQRLEKRKRSIKAWSRLTQRDWRGIRALANREERSIAAQVGLIVRRYLRGEIIDAPVRRRGRKAA